MGLATKRKRLRREQRSTGLKRRTTGAKMRTKDTKGLFLKPRAAGLERGLED